MSEVKNAAYALSIAVVFAALIFSFALVESSKNIGSLSLARPVQVAAAGSAQLAVQATSTPSATVAAATATPRPTLAPPSKAQLKLDDRPFKGKADAKVTLVEFSDFQCPFCARYFSQAGKQVMSEYVDAGKVKFVYLDFPLDSIHPNARPAAEAGKCAYKLGGSDAFFKFHDSVFNNQDELGDASYAKWAKEAGVDETKFKECYDGKQYAAETEADYQQGIANGVSGTPAFFVLDSKGNSRNIVGAQPFAAFQQALDAALAS